MTSGPGNSIATYFAYISDFARNLNLIEERGLNNISFNASGEIFFWIINNGAMNYDNDDDINDSHDEFD